MEFGSRAKDKITGFVGVVIGRCNYITGCDQVLLAPAVKEDGSFQESHWFDVDRIEILPDPPVTLESQTANGCDLTAPIK